MPTALLVLVRAGATGATADEHTRRVPHNALSVAFPEYGFSTPPHDEQRLENGGTGLTYAGRKNFGLWPAGVFG